MSPSWRSIIGLERHENETSRFGGSTACRSHVASRAGPRRLCRAMALKLRALSNEAALQQLVVRLRNKRRRLRLYWLLWGALVLLSLVMTLSNSPRPLSDLLEVLPMIALWALWLAVLSLRARYLHPRWLAAHRRLLADLGRLDGGEERLEKASEAGLLDDLRQAQHRLRRRCTGLGIHQSELLSELAHSSLAAEQVASELAATADALADASLRRTDEDEVARIIGRRRHAWIRLEGYLATLVACECEAQMAADYLERREALELLRRGQSFLAGESSLQPPAVASTDAAVVDGDAAAVS